MSANSYWGVRLSRPTVRQRERQHVDADQQPEGDAWRQVADGPRLPRITRDGLRQRCGRLHALVDGKTYSYTDVYPTCCVPRSDQLILRHLLVHRLHAYHWVANSPKHGIQAPSYTINNDWVDATYQDGCVST